MTTTKKGFLPKSNITYFSDASGTEVVITADQIIDVVAKSNHYLASLTPMFAEIGFDIYESLGQRNLSGFIGEVFSKTFGKNINGFTSNPHADGRPDILDLTSEESRTFFQTECCIEDADKRKMIKKKGLTPFKFGGLEIKSSIGNPAANYKKLLLKAGLPNFEIGMPRIEYTSSITFWGHHTSCKSLIGLYYDYVPEVDSAPQILAVMYSELDPLTDWHKVSVGKEGSKKTSNTSLTTAGREKLYNRVITVTNKDLYLERLAAIGLAI